MPLEKSETRKGTTVFYALCLLYVLSTATIVIDLIIIAIEVSNNFYLQIYHFLISSAVSHYLYIPYTISMDD